ncbi:hypothetical protein DFH08DRAFT_959081 [Mycena albidolilacea]|uniref:DUF6699 domain-containing protein n=1 Tax=Mycena albidolilacea TaxID=1033008 RepID=A0AAD7ERT7_9AGAR|nr:hypothetical protein DFH08DRAFT_959081 [Mycena albidolilacea]
MLPTTHPRQLRIGFESDAGGREIVLEDHLHHHDWKVVLRASWSISAPTVGKTVDKLYQKVGHYVENIVDRCLDRKGTVGPDFVSANIKAYFGSGTGEERYRALCEMRGSFPDALELDCMKLMKYTRRTAALETQHLAFMTIVDLGTLFPGLREIFLRSKCMKDAQSMGVWQALAATYLSDTTIAHILEKRNAEEWGDWEKQSAGTCTLHHLLNQYNVRASESTKALCVRYVGSVLGFPSFWAKRKGLNERTPGQIATRLCSMLMHVLEDLDIREVEPQSFSLNLDWSFDTDGADRFAKVFLTGISDWFSENDDENRAQPWFNKLEKVVSFLRGPRSAKLLPISSTLARSAAFQHCLPASWKIVDFDEASSSLNLDAKGNTAANTNPLHREGANRHIQAGRSSVGENEIEIQSSGSESAEHQTLDAQPSTLSSVSSSDSKSAATFESQSQTVFSHRNSLEQNTETGGDLESGAGAFEVLSPQDNDAHMTVPETQPQGTENYLGIRAVHAQVELNPLIAPLVDNPPAGTNPPYLKWNMLFPSNHCHRSDESPHISWSNGRHEPATFPRVTVLQLVSESFPWVIKIAARQRDIGVTCGEVIDYICRDMYQLTRQAEYEALSSGRKRIVSEAYRHNRSRAAGVPGAQLRPGMLRLDWIGGDAMFGGVKVNEGLVRRVCGDLLPCTFQLVCLRRYPMTAEELRNQEHLQRTLSEREARRGARRSTVVSVTDEDVTITRRKTLPRTRKTEEDDGADVDRYPTSSYNLLP